MFSSDNATADPEILTLLAACLTERPGVKVVTLSTIALQALKAIRYICQNVNSAVFKKACGGVAAAPIRDAERWTGPNHPLLGNSLNMRVRDAAKETLDEIFKVDSQASSPQLPKPATVPDLKSRIQGYGSTTSSRIQSTYAASTGLASSKDESSNMGGNGKYGGFGSDDVYRAELAGSSWLAAAQGRQVCALPCHLFFCLATA
jgi:hypothetical protein